MLLGFRNLGFPRGSRPDAPAAPTVAAPTSPLTLVVSWSAPSFDGGIPISSYVLERRIGAGAWVTASTNAVSPFSDSGLTQGSSYNYRVAAVNAAGQSDFSAASNSQTVVNAPATPSAPSIASPTVSGSLSVSWSAPSNGGSAITGYTLQRDQNNNSWTTVYTGTGTSFTNSGLTPNTAYRFRVLATNAVGNSSYSSPSAAVKPWIAMVATGGTQTTITVSGRQFRVHSFASGTANFTVSSLGSDTSVNYLIVAGGGSGGVGRAGGGGAGGVRSATHTVSVGTFPAAVGGGAGQAFNDTRGNNGGTSSVFGISSTGGGGGGGWTSRGGRGGGSGGGGAGGAGNTGGGAGTAGQGNSGGTSNNRIGGGGGGAGAGGSSPGNGGTGVSNTLRTGSSVFYGGGGGGGSNGTTVGTGGAGGGGTGSNQNGVSGGFGATNTGGGGGGSEGPFGPSGAGGSGIVVIRYPLQAP